MSTDTARNVVDGVVATTVFATWVGWLPTFVAALTGVYTIMRIIAEWPRFKAAVIRWFQ